MLGATREMRAVLISGIRGGVGLDFMLCLIPFLISSWFLDSFGFAGVQEVSDGRLDATEIRWVRACIDCSLDFV